MGGILGGKTSRRAVHHQFLDELKKSGQDAPKKILAAFAEGLWHTPPRHDFCHPESGKRLSGEEGGILMEEQVRKMFQRRDTEDFTAAPEEEDTTELGVVQLCP